LLKKSFKSTYPLAFWGRYGYNIEIDSIEGPNLGLKYKVYKIYDVQKMFHLNYLGFPKS